MVEREDERAGQDAVMGLIDEVLRLTARLGERAVTRRIREGKIDPKTNKSGTTLVKRGNLLRSIKARVGTNEVVISAGGAGIPHARIHHDGGVIVPRTAQYLAIPLTPKAALYNARDYPGETFIKKGIIWEKTEKNKIMAVYVLKKSVTMPARPYMYLDDSDMREIENTISEHIQRSVKELTDA